MPPAESPEALAEGVGFECQEGDEVGDDGGQSAAPGQNHAEGVLSQGDAVVGLEGVEERIDTRLPVVECGIGGHGTVPNHRG